MYQVISKIDLSKYVEVSEYPENRFEYHLKALKDKSYVYSRANKAKFVFKRCTSEPYIHIGEKVAYEIARKLKIKCCKVDLFKEDEKKFVYPSRGSISYFDESSDDYIVNPYWALIWYEKRYGIKLYPTSIDTIFKACKEYYFDKSNSTDEDFRNFMQDFIDMTIFDLKFGNYDRRENNWLLRLNKKTERYDLYPMFDNEAILGFANDELDDMLYQKIKEYDDSLKSMVCTKQDSINGKYSTTKDILEYLLCKYPEMTRNSIIKAFAFTKEDLEEILDNIPNLPNVRREITLELFCYRDSKIREILEEYFKENRKENKKRADKKEER